MDWREELHPRERGKFARKGAAEEISRKAAEEESRAVVRLAGSKATALVRTALENGGFTYSVAQDATPTGKNVPRFTEEHAWCFAKRPGLRWDGFTATMIDLPKLAAGCMADEERILNSDGTAAHPTQKPLRLMTWILAAIRPGSVLDPFAGTGTTLDACLRLGISASGIERDERYCELTALRLERVIPQGDLFQGR